MSIALPTDTNTPIQRISDSQSITLHCTGGIRAEKRYDNAWEVTPFLKNGKVCSIGYFSQAQLQAFLKKANLLPIAQEHSNWAAGNYYSDWSPIYEGGPRVARGPSDFWQSIATNLARPRWSALRSNPSAINPAKVFNDQTIEESLARSISQSLRSMDISVEKIADFYNEQLGNMIAAGRVSGHRVGSPMDQTLYAHVHAFFLQYGSARDYLATFIALKLSLDFKKVNNLARLTDKLRTSSFLSVPILEHMRTTGLFEQKPDTLDKWKIAGWLERASSVRNQLVHNRPYGLMFSENTGQLLPIDQEVGLFRYFRPLHFENQVESDVLDEIVIHYKHISELFQKAAEVSGRDASMLTISANMIKSVTVTRTPAAQTN